MKKMTNSDKIELKNTLLLEMLKHVGKSNAIGMGELYQRVFGKPWNHRINDTRELRSIISELREGGTPICSSAGKFGGGYWVAAAGSELDGYCKKLRARALKILTQEAKLRKITLSELTGGIQLSLPLGV